MSFLNLADPSIKPFHNDEKLQRLIVASINSGLGFFIETGTFRGDSLKWVASIFPGVLCFSCEKKLSYWVYAKAHMRNNKNTIIKHQDSREFLKFLTHYIGPSTPSLFWLDAHWGKDWPLLEELQIIKESKVKGIIIIDDFDIEKPEFGFMHDSYNGYPLNLQYISKYFDSVYVPNYPATGHFAGYAVIPLDWPLPSNSDLNKRSLQTESGARAIQEVDSC